MAQTIDFPYYDSTNRVPGVYVDIDASRANTATFNARTLLIGQITASGTATPNIPVIIGSLSDAQAKCGSGSMLYDMVQNYRNADNFGELWILPLADNGAGTAGTGTVALTGTATAAGTLNLYVAGTNVQVKVNANDAAATVATAIVTAVGKYPSLPVTAAASTGTVTFTAKHKGIAGSDVQLQLNYYGAANGEVTPAGLTATITAMSAGTADPVLDTALVNLSSNAV